MSDFLLELRSEEIPARMQAGARENLAKLFAAELATAGLAAAEIVTCATPRRLALIARGLPAETQATREELKGPKTSAPPQALDGFLRKTGLTRDQLTEREGVFYAVTERPGRATVDVLAAAIPAIIRQFPWPKSMRWGDASASSESLRWVRPLHGIVALFGEEIVPVEIAGIASGTATLGHRFHHPGIITIGSAADYAEKLRACHVIVDQDERARIIRDRAAALAAEAGLQLIEDEGLVAENAGLTEWPVPLLGRFDDAFLDVPPEVIQLTARVNQKYFVCRAPSAPLPGREGPGVGQTSRDAEGTLANAFICVANIAARDDGARIVEGNRKVLAARLADARFFYETDLKTPLAEQAKKLDRIVFHEKLGTVADKVERVAKLAEWLATEGIVPGCDPKLARRAAELAKTDLVTGMVGEFPELQGVMGGYYATAQGEDPQVAAAIRDHYKPVGQGDEVPTAPVTVAVSLADKLDTLMGFYGVDEKPTGSKDPFALRRATLGVIAITIANELRFGLADAWEDAASFLAHSIGDDGIGIGNPAAWQITKTAFWTACNDVDPWDFFTERLKVQQREAGIRHDLIDAVFALGGEDDLVRLLARVRALQAFVGTDDGANLLAGYKRAANILRKEGYTSTRHPGLVPGSTAPPNAAPAEEGMPEQVRHDDKVLSYTPEPAETALLTALDAAEPAAADAVAREDFTAAMAALATLRAPIDAFFDGVTVNDPDPAKRLARLALLDRVRAAVHTVADFSRIEG